jgi:hypothetical protein
MFEPPRLLYKTQVQRSRYWRRLVTLLLGAFAASGAYWALTVAQRREVVTTPFLLDFGRLVAVILAGQLFVLSGLTLYRALTRRSVRIQVFDKGLTWRTPLRVAKIPWQNISRVREGATGIYIGSMPLLQWGAHRLTTRGGAVYRFSARHGDPRRFMKAARPYLAHVHGIRMGRALREEQPVKLHPRLTVYPGGVEVNGREIAWSRLDTYIDRGRLIIRQRRDNGRFRTVARFPVTRIDNLGGFMQVATETMRNAQPERRKRTTTTAKAVTASGAG